MEGKYDGLIRTLKSKLISNGHFRISIILHNNIWKDIFIEDLSENSDADLVEIGKIGFVEILNDCKVFIDYGEINYELWIENHKIKSYKKKKIERIHNKKVN